jgi:hypothetical protein
LVGGLALEARSKLVVVPDVFGIAGVDGGMNGFCAASGKKK